MMSRLRSLWRNFWHRGRVDRDLDEEVRAVFDLLVDEKMRAGLPAAAARRAATLELGRVEAITQQVREERAGASLDAVLNDVRYGARMLRANPGFTLVVVLSLAAGIGANSAMFSVANALLLRSLPVASPDTLYMAGLESPLPLLPRFSYPFFEKVRAAFPDPAGVAVMSRVTRVQARLPSAAATEAANLQLVSGEFFDVLGLQPALGRFIAPQDNTIIGGHPVAVISDAFWRRRFGADPAAIGSQLTMNTTPFTVIGVAPPGFTGVWLESPADVWAPVMMQADVRYVQSFSATGDSDIQRPWVAQDSLSWLEIILRADRADGPQAVALNAVYRPIMLQQADQLADPEERKRTLATSMILTPFANGSSALRDRFRTPLVALMVMVALLLLIACVNAANLLLSRAAARQREMAVRLSIGASRARVMSQLLIESVLLGTLAAAVGLAIAPLASELLVRMTIGIDTGPLPFAVGIDTRVLAFTAAVTLLTSILFGFAPAWRATDLSLSTALKANGRGTHRGARLNLSKALVIAQVSLSLLLVVGAGLFLRSFGNLASLSLGFAADHVISVSINPSSGGFAERELPGLYRRVIDRVEALPGVDSAALAMCGLMTGCRSNVGGLAADGYVRPPGEEVLTQLNRVGLRYFSTVGMPLVAGRDFDERDRDSAAKVAIVNETLARRYFKDGDAVGRRIGYDTPDTEIVGIVGDARVNAVREAVAPMVFYPLDATPSFLGTLQVRTAADPESLGLALRKALQDSEPQLPVDRVTTVMQLAANTLRQERLIARLTTVIGVLALGLACIGLYALMSYAVKQRVAELGIRFALGAPRPRVLWMVFRESLTLVGLGILAGLPLVALLSRLVDTMLFGVGPRDPAIVFGAIVALLLVGAASGYLPAWRASRVDPLTALRQD